MIFAPPYTNHRAYEDQSPLKLNCKEHKFTLFFEFDHRGQDIARYSLRSFILNV